MGTPFWSIRSNVYFSSTLAFKSFSTLGETPRNFAIVGQGDYLIAANQNTDNIVFFKLNSESGALQATGLEIEVPMPVCLEILSCSW